MQHQILIGKLEHIEIRGVRMALQLTESEAALTFRWMPKQSKFNSVWRSTNINIGFNISFYTYIIDLI